MLIAIDTETTGLDFKNDDVIEFAAVICGESDHVDVVREFIRSERTSSEQALAKHHLTPKILKEKTLKAQNDSLMSVLAFLYSFRDDLFVGMNIPFDMTMLKHNMSRHLHVDTSLFGSFNCYDVMVVDKVIRKSVGERRNLATLAEVYNSMTKPDHSALNDARCTLEIAVQQIDMLEKLYEKTFTNKELSDFCRKHSEEQTASLNEWLVSKGEKPRLSGFPILQI